MKIFFFFPGILYLCQSCLLLGQTMFQKIFQYMGNRQYCSVSAAVFTDGAWSAVTLHVSSECCLRFSVVLQAKMANVISRARF